MAPVGIFLSDTTVRANGEDLRVSSATIAIERRYPTTYVVSPLEFARLHNLAGTLYGTFVYAGPSLDRAALDRLALGRARADRSLPEPRALSPLALERRPSLVRRAPRPAGRPSGWRRLRKGGRRT